MKKECFQSIKPQKTNKSVYVKFDQVIFGHEYGVDLLCPTFEIGGKHNKDYLKMCKFLAEQLEKYLNEEI